MTVPRRFLFCGSFMIFCLAFAMPLCASVYMCLVVTCWERADLLALVCGVLLWVCHFPIGILGQVWYLIVSIPDMCTLTYFIRTRWKELIWFLMIGHLNKILQKCKSELNRLYVIYISIKLGGNYMAETWFADYKHNRHYKTTAWGWWLCDLVHIK